jgi:hypothetical protein
VQGAASRGAKEDQIMTASKQTNRADILKARKPARQTGKKRAIPVPLEVATKRTDGKGGSKRALLIERISRPEGARIGDLTKELGWLPHTVRAALTGLRRKGYIIARENAAGETSIYRATPPGAQNAFTPQKGKTASRSASKRAA